MNLISIPVVNLDWMCTFPLSVFASFSRHLCRRNCERQQCRSANLTKYETEAHLFYFVVSAQDSGTKHWINLLIFKSWKRRRSTLKVPSRRPNIKNSLITNKRQKRPSVRERTKYQSYMLWTCIPWFVCNGWTHTQMIRREVLMLAVLFNSVWKPVGGNSRCPNTCILIFQPH